MTHVSLQSLDMDSARMQNILGSLFRSNSVAARLLKDYSRFVGKSYLEKTIEEVLESICSSNLDCEIDPSRATNGNNQK